MLSKKFFITIIFCMSFLLLLTGCNAPKQLLKKAPANANFNNIPTIFLHGYGGNAGSMQSIINSIESNNFGTAVEVIHVRTNQTLATSGTLTAKLNNPLINVVFDDSTNGNPKRNATALKAIIETLYQQHHFDRFNIVAHSMGNSTLAEYLLKYHNDKTLPTLNKYVALANVSNSFIGGNSGDSNAAKSPLNSGGQPTIMSNNFKSFKKLHTSFPQGAKVLNIFGNLDDGSNSDGRVPINSAQSLKYLTHRAKSYREIEFHGNMAQHSKLRQNSAVQKATIQFLFE